MSQGGPTTTSNLRVATHREQLIHLYGEPWNVGAIACASTTVPVSNSTTAVPFTLMPGQIIDLQSDTPCFVGFGPTSATAAANALAKSKRLDAWEPFRLYLNDRNTTGVSPVQPININTAYYVAAVLQSAGSMTLYVSNVT